VVDGAQQVGETLTNVATDAAETVAAPALSLAETVASRNGVIWSNPSYLGSDGYAQDYYPYNLTPAEVRFIIRHPFVARDFQSAANKALAEAQSRFPADQLHNGQGDAFRHAYWNALMTRAHGSSLAKEFADAHETNPNQPANEKEMDLHNNEVGRQIAVQNPNATDAQLAELVMQALREGRLRTIK
jgi:hypothetical protein